MWRTGGVQIATGVAIDEFSGVVGYIGTGELSVGAGKHLISVATPKIRRRKEEDGATWFEALTIHPDAKH